MDIRCLPNALRIEFSRSVLRCSYCKLMRAYTNQSDAGKAYVKANHKLHG